MATYTEGQMLDGKKAKPFLYLPLGDDVVMFAVSGVPVDGTSGSGAGIAGPGSVCVRYDASPKMYINGGTKASPTWKLVTSAA